MLPRTFLPLSGRTPMSHSFCMMPTAHIAEKLCRSLTALRRTSGQKGRLISRAKLPYMLLFLSRQVGTTEHQVIFAHADCTHGKGSIQNEFNLKGFPGFLFWRQSAPLEELVDQVFVVISELEGEPAMLRRMMSGVCCGHGGVRS